MCRAAALPSQGAADAAPARRFEAEGYYHKAKKFAASDYISPEDNTVLMYESQVASPARRPGGAGQHAAVRARLADARAAGRQFIPCPQGLNPETFRFWEALEAGAIPVRVHPLARQPARG